MTSLNAVIALNPKRVPRLLGALAIPLCLVSGCAIGPDYVRPRLPESLSLGASGSSRATSKSGDGDAQITSGQRLIQGAEIPSDWWTAFGSPDLNRLVERALAANPNIDVAHAALRAAQENVSAQRGYFFPTVQANYAPLRVRNPNSQSGNTPGAQTSGPGDASRLYNFHTAQLTVGFNPDVFGVNKRLVESLQASARLQRFQLEATTLTLASNVVAAAIQEALLRQQLATTEALIGSGVRALGIVQRQQSAGVASKLDVANQETGLAQARQLVGVARANRLPQFSIDASLGGGARSFAGMFSSGGPFFNLAGNLAAPLFDGGTLRFRERAARENLNVATAQYQATVINAFQNVADTLQAIQSDTEALDAALGVERSARVALALTEKQHASGYIDRLVLLNAQRTVFQASFDVAQAQASRLGNSAALFQALGGGWQSASNNR